jgi:hypothetical protein
MALPRERLKCVSIVCGLGPPDIGMKGVKFWNWVGFSMGYRYSIPSMVFLVRWFWQRDPIARLDLTDNQRLELMLQHAERVEGKVPAKDLAVMKDVDILRLQLRSARESFAQGYDGTLQDGKLKCVDWGFRVEDIRPDLPVQLWYSKHDMNVPVNHGVQIAARLGGRAHLRVEDETHASIWANMREDILTELVKSKQ